MELTAQEIEELVRRHPLREGVADAVMNRTELASFFECTLGTISSWIAAGMPALVHGAQGREYEFQASHCWAWKCARDASEQMRSEAAKASIAAQRLAMVGGAPGDTIQALSPKERRELYEVEAAHERLARERNQSLDRDDVSETFSDIMRLVRDTVSAWPDHLERSAELDQTVIVKLVERCDDLLDLLHAAIVKFFADRPITDRQPKPKDLFDVAAE